MFREIFWCQTIFHILTKKMPLNIKENLFKKLCIHRHSCPIQCCKPLNFYSCMTCTWHKRGERNATLKLAFFPHFLQLFCLHIGKHIVHSTVMIFFFLFVLTFFMANARNLLYNWFLRKFDFQFNKIVKRKKISICIIIPSYMYAIKFRFRSYHIYLSKSAKK